MKEQELHCLIDQVKRGKLSRRRFIEMMVNVGLTAPMASQMLAWCGVAIAQAILPYKPTKRGGGGLLRLLWWQAPTLLNPTTHTIAQSRRTDRWRRRRWHWPRLHGRTLTRY